MARRYNRPAARGVARKFGGKPNDSKLHAELNGSKRTKRQKKVEDNQRLFEFVIIALVVDYQTLKEQGASYYFPDLKNALRSGVGVYPSLGHVPIERHTAVYLVRKDKGKWSKPVLQVVSSNVNSKLRWKGVPPSVQQR